LFDTAAAAWSRCLLARLALGFLGFPDYFPIVAREN
jgi:hypothetical protein